MPVPRLPGEARGHDEAKETPEPKAADTTKPMFGMKTSNTG